jgi:flagellar motor switch/type III secretory pathway protein FliN
MQRVDAFPWESLLTVTRDSIGAFRSAIDTLVNYIDPLLFASEVARLVPELDVRLPHVTSARAVLPSAIAVRLCAVDVLGASPGAIVEIDAACAVAIVSRVLRRDQVPLARERFVPEALAGAWAAVLMRVLRASSRQAAIVAFEAGPADRVSNAWVTHNVAHTILVGSLAYAEQTYAYRVLIGPHPLNAARALTRGDLATMGSVPLHLPVVGAEGSLPREEFESLRTGDVWVPDTWHVSCADGRLEGNPLVATTDFSYAWRSTITRHDQLSLGPGSENSMTPVQDSSDALIAGLASAPVSLRVELGSVELTARQWAALAPGAVVSTGLPLGARVILRAGGVAVATAELVNVEGELGVRILERTHD